MGGVYKFVTDYDKIKKNIREIGKDISNIWLKIIHRKKQTKTESQPGKDKETEREIRIYQEIPDELKKYYGTGKDTVIISEKETVTYHKICIMRDDLKEEIQKEISEKEVRTINLKSTQDK